MMKKVEKIYVRNKKKDFLELSENVEKNEKENDKNIRMKLRRRNANKVLNPIENIDSDSIFEKLLHSPMKQKVNLKPMSFWSKKLKDLESGETEKNKCRYELYEFSASEESYSDTKKKKKALKKKIKLKKQKVNDFERRITKQTTKLRDLKTKKSKKLLFEQKVIAPEKVNMESIKNNNLSHNSDSLAVTSTPDPKRLNLIGVYNFMFLSPVKKIENEELLKVKTEDDPSINSTLKSAKHKTTNTVKKKKKEKTPFLTLNTLNNERVLRSRKVLNM